MNDPANAEDRVGGGSEQQEPMNAAQPSDAVRDQDEQQDVESYVYIARCATVRLAKSYLNNMLDELKKVDAVETMRKEDGSLDWNKICSQISISGSVLQGLHSDLKTESGKLGETSNSRKFSMYLGRMENEISSLMDLVERYEIFRKPKEIERVHKRKQNVIKILRISIQDVKELFEDVLADIKDSDDDDNDDEKDGADDKNKGQKTSRRNSERNLENASSAKRFRKKGVDQEIDEESAEFDRDQPAVPPAQK